MSAARRAARRERQAAELLGTKRVRRSRYESAPDVEPVTLPSGDRLSVEVKTRAALPALVTKALAQGARYGARGDVPAAVLSATGAEPVIVLPLRAFRRLVGLDAAPPLPLFENAPRRHDDDRSQTISSRTPQTRIADEDASTRHGGASSTERGDAHDAQDPFDAREAIEAELDADAARLSDDKLRVVACLAATLATVERLAGANGGSR